jgi:hypothetical protein
MTLESLELRKPVSMSSGKTKSMIVIGGIVLTIIVVVGMATPLSSSVSSSDTKHAICTVKVLELAQNGIIRDSGGYNGAIYECTHMTGWSSVYGKASS